MNLFWKILIKTNYNVLLKILNVSNIAYSTKKGPNVVIMFSEETAFTPNFYRQYFFLTELELVESYSESLWFLIPWTTLSGWYSHGYALKSAKICFHPLKYFLIPLHLIRRKILNLSFVYQTNVHICFLRHASHSFCIPNIKFTFHQIWLS